MHFSFLLSGFSKNSGRKSGFMKIQDINRDIFEIVPNSGRAPEFGTLWSACIYDSGKG